MLASWALPRGCRRLRDGTGWRCAPRTTRWSTSSSRARSRAVSTAAAGCPSGTRARTTVEFRDREVIVVLHGERVSGRYVLFRTDGKNWMIHRMDPPDDPGRELLPEGIAPMLAKPGSLPTNADDWAFEIKWDGVRLLAYVQGGRIDLRGRSGLDMTATYPELRELAAALGMVECVLDGEVVALDEGGVPRFELLQQRMNVTGTGGRAAGPQRPGALPDLRPAVPRRAQRDVAAVPRPPAAARGAGAGRPGLGHARVPRRRRPRDARVHARARHGGRDREAARQPLRGGPPLGRVAEDQARAADHARDRRLHPRPDGRTGHIGAVVLGERLGDGTLRCAGKAGSGLTAAVIDELEAVLVRRPTARSVRAPSRREPRSWSPRTGR